jgi:hypothetical protein
MKTAIANSGVFLTALFLLNFTSHTASAFSANPLDDSKADLATALNSDLNSYMPQNSRIESIQWIGADQSQNPIYAIKADNCIINVVVVKTPIPRGIGSGMVERKATVMTKSSACPAGPTR